MIGQTMKVVADGTRLLGRWVGAGSPPPFPVERDATIARLRKRRRLVYPAFTAASCGVHEQDRWVVSPGIRVPELHAGKIYVRHPAILSPAWFALVIRPRVCPAVRRPLPGPQPRACTTRVRRRPYPRPC